MFLNSDLKEEIYLKPPDRIDIEGNVLELRKASYGLK